MCRCPLTGGRGGRRLPRGARLRPVREGHGPRRATTRRLARRSAARRARRPPQAGASEAPQPDRPRLTATTSSAARDARGDRPIPGIPRAAQARSLDHGGRPGRTEARRLAVQAALLGAVRPDAPPPSRRPRRGPRRVAPARGAPALPQASPNKPSSSSTSSTPNPSAMPPIIGSFTRGSARRKASIPRSGLSASTSVPKSPSRLRSAAHASG